MPKRDRLAQRRVDLGYTQEGLACAMGVATSTVARWEASKANPSPYQRPKLAQLLHVTLPDLADLLGSATVNTTPPLPEEDTVDRRKFIGTAAGAAAGIVVLPGIAQAREGIASALTPTEDGDLAYLEGAFERHRGGYRGRSPDQLLGEMMSDLALLQDTLGRPHPARTRADLARTAAGITGLVAIVQHDRGDQRDAHNWFATAARAARESGDQRMLAWVLARHAMVPLNYGASSMAARIAEQARAEAGTTPSAAGALAAAVTARARAASGDREGAARALDDVRTLVEQLPAAESADTWFGYPEQKHAVHLSQAYTLLGDTSNAHAAQEEALRLTDSPSVMTRALVAMDTAACLRVDGDHTGAAEMAVGVWQRLPSVYREGLIRSRASLLHEKLTGRAHEVLGGALAGC
ncbi:helix-turn-helix transcriptional regulator [Kitasatospora sp. NPDC094028]